MTDQRSPEQLADWMRVNRGAFTREALERAAAEQGWTPEEIDAALGLVEAAEPASEWASHTAGGGTGRRGELLALLILLVPITGLALLAEATLRHVSADNPATPGLILGMGLTIAIPILALVWVSRRRLPLGGAGLIGLALIANLAVFGTCVASMSLAQP